MDKIAPVVLIIYDLNVSTPLSDIEVWIGALARLVSVLIARDLNAPVAFITCLEHYLKIELNQSGASVTSPSRPHQESTLKKHRQIRLSCVHEWMESSLVGAYFERLVIPNLSGKKSMHSGEFTTAVYTQIWFLDLMLGRFRTKQKNRGSGDPGPSTSQDPLQEDEILPAEPEHGRQVEGGSPHVATPRADAETGTRNSDVPYPSVVAAFFDGHVPPKRFIIHDIVVPQGGSTFQELVAELDSRISRLRHTNHRYGNTLPYENTVSGASRPTKTPSLRCCRHRF